MNIQVEVCAGSFYDCIQAELGGAKRVELNSALYLGGLTPTLGTLDLVKKHTELKVIAMLRPRAGGFCYSDEDFYVMMKDAELLLEHGADGIAFGCLDASGIIQMGQTKLICEIIKRKGKEAVFHRAFDCVNDPFTAMEQLISMGIDRVLTSGQKPTALQGKMCIHELQLRYGNAIEILAGSGIREDNVCELIQCTGISQVHSSCKSYLEDPTAEQGAVSFSYLSYPSNSAYDVVSKDHVRNLIDAVHQIKRL